jgi:hypothetical protein
MVDLKPIKEPKVCVNSNKQPKVDKKSSKVYEKPSKEPNAKPSKETKGCET